MRKMLHGLITVAILATASSAMAGDDSGEAGLDRLIKGRVAGKPVACINAGRIRGIQIIDRTAIIYRMSNGQIYVNRPALGAANLDSDAVINTSAVEGPLCSNEFVTFYDQGGMGMRGVAASVAMGPFVPYALAQR